MVVKKTSNGTVPSSATTSKKKQQSSLNSFFGAAETGNNTDKGKKQKRINSFFAKPTSSSTSINEAKESNSETNQTKTTKKSQNDEKQKKKETSPITKIRDKEENDNSKAKKKPEKNSSREADRDTNSTCKAGDNDSNVEGVSKDKKSKTATTTSTKNNTSTKPKPKSEPPKEGSSISNTDNKKSITSKKRQKAAPQSTHKDTDKKKQKTRTKKAEKDEDKQKKEHDDNDAKDNMNDDKNEGKENKDTKSKKEKMDNKPKHTSKRKADAVPAPENSNDELNEEPNEKKKTKSTKKRVMEKTDTLKSKRMKRRVIEDSDDDDDDDEKDEKEDTEDDDDNDETYKSNNSLEDSDEDEEEDELEDEEEEMADVDMDEDIEEDDEESASAKKIAKQSKLSFKGAKQNTSSASKSKRSSKASAKAKKLEVNDVLSVPSNEDLLKAAVSWLNNSNGSDIPSNNKLASTISKNTKATSNAKNSSSSVGIPYSLFCAALTQIESTTKRLEIQSILTKLFRTALLTHPTNLIHLVYLSCNAVAPKYDCVELGIGDALLMKAIVQSCGMSNSVVKARYEEHGDLGTVAEMNRGKQKTLSGMFGGMRKLKPLMALEVLDVFRHIATTSGNQSQKFKIDKIKSLLVRATNPNETKYVIRGLQGKLRIGLAQSTVLISLAHALTHTPPKTVCETEDERNKDNNDADDGNDEKVSKDDLYYPADAQKLRSSSKLPIETKLECAVSIIRRCYSHSPSLDNIVSSALTHPLHLLPNSCTLTPGVPVEPMLAKPTKSIREVLSRLDGHAFTCEYKYDGERAQVHLYQTTDENDNTKTCTKMGVFSRNLLDTSIKFPESATYVQEACSSTSVTSCVLDTEVVAYNRTTQKFVPFQVLSTRKNKGEAGGEESKITVIVQAFDLMYLNGNSLLHKTLSERRGLMHQYFKPIENKFQFATSMDYTPDDDNCVDTSQLEEFLENAVKNQCEGLMVKTLQENAAYEPSKRSLNWLKLKKDYLEGCGDSFDLVPIGAYHGKGKRTGNYGAYLLACYDVESEDFQSVCKIGTGFSDVALQELAAGFKEHIISKKSSQYIVSEQLECDVWFDAMQVWEIKAADLSKSSAHKGALGKTGEVGRGIGLRFPRFERLRDDKRVDQATSSDQILDMYYAQDSIVDGGGGDDDEDGI